MIQRFTAFRRNLSKLVDDGKVGHTQYQRNADDEPQLPYATRQAKEKFPVTLYTSANCVGLAPLGPRLTRWCNSSI
jgi:hypothetical protein